MDHSDEMRTVSWSVVTMKRSLRSSWKSRDQELPVQGRARRAKAILAWMRRGYCVVAGRRCHPSMWLLADTASSSDVNTSKRVLNNLQGFRKELQECLEVWKPAC